MSEVPKNIYRIIEKYEEYYVELWHPPVSKWFFFKTKGFWLCLEAFDTIEEAKQAISRIQKYSDGPNVVWQSNTTDLVEQALLDKNDN